MRRAGPPARPHELVRRPCRLPEETPHWYWLRLGGFDGDQIRSLEKRDALRRRRRRGGVRGPRRPPRQASSRGPFAGIRPSRPGLGEVLEREADAHLEGVEHRRVNRVGTPKGEALEIGVDARIKAEASPTGSSAILIAGNEMSAT